MAGRTCVCVCVCGGGGKKLNEADRSFFCMVTSFKIGLKGPEYLGTQSVIVSRNYLEQSNMKKP